MPRAIDRHETRRLMEERGAQLVDVLPQPEHEAVHIPGSVSLPLKSIEPDTIAELDRDRPVIVYCSGHT